MVIEGAMLVRIWRQSVKCSWEMVNRGCNVGENMATECKKIVEDMAIEGKKLIRMWPQRVR